MSSEVAIDDPPADRPSPVSESDPGDERVSAPTLATAEIQVLRAQFDALRTQVLKDRTPWFKTPSTIIALAALLFSFGTTAASCKRLQQQERHDARVELRTLLMRLSALPREHLDIQVRHANNHTTLSNYLSIFALENTFLARQAYQIIRSIPDDVSPTEYIAVATSLQQVSLWEESREMLEQARARSRDPADRIAAHRGMAALSFHLGDLHAGREGYRRALGVFSEPGMVSANRQYVEATNAWTHVHWAAAELTQGRCQDAAAELREVDQYLSQPRATGLGINDPLGGQVAAMRRMMEQPNVCPPSGFRTPGVAPAVAAVQQSVAASGAAAADASVQP